MLRALIISVFMVAAFAPPLAASAGEQIAVIVNKNNPVAALTEIDIRKIHDNRVLTWPDGAPIIIYDLSVDDPLREVFSKKIFGRSPSRIAEDWAHLKITNQAKNPPITVKSEALIIRRVANEKGAIGYVSLKSVADDQGVKVVTTIE